MNPKVNFFFEKEKKWQQEVETLRTIALDSGLAEELKWGCPCYTLNGTNVVLIHTFKEYCAYLFFKGAIMPDPQKILIQQTENVQSARQVRFTSQVQVVEMSETLRSYIAEAIKVEKSGAKVELKKTAEFKMPHEFEVKLNSIPALKEAFEKLTPGRQRNYLLHFSQPKQAATREARIEKAMPLIMNGKGLND